MKPIDPTVQGLRQALFDEINNIRQGQQTIQRAAVIHKLATQIILLTQMEINNGAALEVRNKNNPIALGKMSL